MTEEHWMQGGSSRLLSAALVALTACTSDPSSRPTSADAGQRDAGRTGRGAADSSAMSPAAQTDSAMGDDAGAGDDAAISGRSEDSAALDSDADAGADVCTPLRLVFQDRFEAASPAWKVCEEIVGTGCSVCGATNRCPTSSCYGSGLASVDIVAGALRVTAGRERASPIRQSDHVIAGHTLSATPLSGIVWYRLTAAIPAATHASGQTGPEFSAQSTNAAHETFTGGVQYLANVFDRAGHWNLWSGAGWHDLTAALKLDATPLAADTTYELALGIDFDKHRYEGFRVRRQGGASSFELSRQQLAAYPIIAEKKGFDSATVLTLESENRYNGCNLASNPKGDGKSYAYSVIYDDVALCAQR